VDLWKPRRNVFVTADTHFGDAVAFQKFARPFASVDAMDGALVAAINECVGKRDVLLHIGDFGGDHTWTTLERARLRAVRDGIACASIVLVRGNVDPVGARWFDRMFEETHDVLTWKGWPGASTAKPLRVVASHYPLLAEEGRSTDIGVDCWSYRPVDLTSVLNMLAARPFQVPTVWPIRQPSRELE